MPPLCWLDCTCSTRVYLCKQTTHTHTHTHVSEKPNSDLTGLHRRIYTYTRRLFRGVCVRLNPYKYVLVNPSINQIRDRGGSRARRPTDFNRPSLRRFSFRLPLFFPSLFFSFFLSPISTGSPLAGVTKRWQHLH